jgi:SAM-dependent methyltransferase
VRAIMPTGIVDLLRQRKERAQLAIDNAKAEEFKRSVRMFGPSDKVPYSWADAQSFLSGLGCDRHQVMSGSISDSSLNYSTNILEKYIKNKPAIGLHVGNFVGISLCHYTNFLHKLDKRSVMVSIDPNLTHRGIKRPMDKVISCLARYGLNGNSMVLTGYSLEKSVSNDGVSITEDYDPLSEYEHELGCENQLSILVSLAEGKFDFAVIDGNHEPDYLTREIDSIARLLKIGGILVLDDVNWDTLRNVYALLDSSVFERIGSDGRVGLAKKLSNRAEAILRNEPQEDV